MIFSVYPSGEGDATSTAASSSGSSSDTEITDPEWTGTQLDSYGQLTWKDSGRTISIYVSGADETLARSVQSHVAFPDTAGPRTVQGTGRLCYASSNRAVAALGHLYRFARFRERRGLV